MLKLLYSITLRIFALVFQAHIDAPADGSLVTVSWKHPLLTALTIHDLLLDYRFHYLPSKIAT